MATDHPTPMTRTQAQDLATTRVLDAIEQARSWTVDGPPDERRTAIDEALTEAYAILRYPDLEGIIPKTCADCTFTYVAPPPGEAWDTRENKLCPTCATRSRRAEDK